MTLPPLPLLLTAATMLLLVGGVALLLARRQAAEALTARTLSVLGPYHHAAPRRDIWQALLEQLPLSGMRQWLAGLLGIDLKHHADYPLRWWIVLAGMVVVARAAAWLIALLVDLPQLPVVPVLWLVLCRFVFGSFATRRRETLYRQFPDALAMVVRALRVGQTVAQALRGVARDAQHPTSVEFARLADRLAIGVPLSEALGEMAHDSGLTEYRFFATTLLLQNQTGGSLSEALDTLAEVIRGRVALSRRGYALAGEARASAIVLAVLPVVTGIALAVMDFDYARLLVDDPIGRRVLGAAIGMLVLGIVVMNTMIRRMLR